MVKVDASFLSLELPLAKVDATLFLLGLPLVKLMLAFVAQSCHWSKLMLLSGLRLPLVKVDASFLS